MSILKNKRGYIMIEAVVAMSIVLISITLILQTIIVNTNIENKVKTKNDICKYIQKSEKIIIYNTEFQEIESLLDKKIYLNESDLNNYSGGGILKIASKYDKENSILQINFKKEDDYVKVKINGISKGEIVESCTFYKGLYEKKRKI